MQDVEPHLLLVHSCLFIFIAVFGPIKDGKSTYSHFQPVAIVPACHKVGREVRLMRLENQFKTVAVFWPIIHIFYHVFVCLCVWTKGVTAM